MKTGLELDTPSKLVKAAISIYRRNDFVGVSAKQIADLAGVNHSSIKYHYSSKDQLWRAGIDYLFQEMDTMMSRNADRWKNMSPRERIVDDIELYVRFNAAHPELLRMIMFESMVRSERYEWLADNYLRPYTDRSLNRIALAQEQGVYRNDIPVLNIHYIALAASRTMFFEAPDLDERFGIDIFAEEEIQRHVDALVKLLVVFGSENIEGSAEYRTA